MMLLQISTAEARMVPLEIFGGPKELPVTIDGIEGMAEPNHPFQYKNDPLRSGEWALAIRDHEFQILPVNALCYAIRGMYDSAFLYLLIEALCDSTNNPSDSLEIRIDKRGEGKPHLTDGLLLYAYQNNMAFKKVRSGMYWPSVPNNGEIAIASSISDTRMGQQYSKGPHRVYEVAIRREAFSDKIGLFAVLFDPVARRAETIGTDPDSPNTWLPIIFSKHTNVRIINYGAWVIENKLWIRAGVNADNIEQVYATIYKGSTKVKSSQLGLSGAFYAYGPYEDAYSFFTAALNPAEIGYGKYNLEITAVYDNGKIIRVRGGPNVIESPFGILEFLESFGPWLLVSMIVFAAIFWKRRKRTK